MLVASIEHKAHQSRHNKYLNCIVTVAAQTKDGCGGLQYNLSLSIVPHIIVQWLFWYKGGKHRLRRHCWMLFYLCSHLHFNNNFFTINVMQIVCKSRLWEQNLQLMWLPNLTKKTSRGNTNHSGPNWTCLGTLFGKNNKARILCSTIYTYKLQERLKGSKIFASQAKSYCRLAVNL